MRPALRSSSLLVACAGLTLVVAALGFASPVEAGPLPPTRQALRDWLRLLAAQASSLETPMTELAPARPLPDQAPARGCAMLIDRDHTAIDGRSIGSGPELAGVIRELRANQQLLHPDAELVAVVDIAGDAPWSRIVRALNQLAHVGVADIALRFARPPLTRPFAKTPLDDELAEIAARSAPADKATRLAQLNLRVFARCPRMSQVLGAMAAASPDTRATLLLTGIDGLLDDPACVVDPPSVQALAWAMLGGRALQTFSIHIDRKAKLRVQAKPAATWHEIVATGQVDAAFAKRGTPVFFVAR